MPPQPAWFHRLPAAIEELERLPCSTVDRFALQKLLHLSKAQAWRVLTQFGGQPVAGGLAVDREELLAKLQALQAGEPCAFEQRRHARVAAHLASLRAELRARQIPIDAPADIRSHTLPDLPAGISLQPGRLVVEFQSTADLLQKLLEISMAAANDYERFRDKVEL